MAICTGNRQNRRKCHKCCFLYIFVYKLRLVVYLLASITDTDGTSFYCGRKAVDWTTADKYCRLLFLYIFRFSYGNAYRKRLIFTQFLFLGRMPDTYIIWYIRLRTHEEKQDISKNKFRFVTAVVQNKGLKQIK